MSIPAAFGPDPNRDPIGPFLHYLMSECGVSPHTLAAYRGDLMRFNSWRKAHAPGPLATLGIGDLAGYVDFLTRSGEAPPPMSRKFAGSPPASLIMSSVAIARPAPLTMQPMSPSRPT